jgi:hypothetical protein
LLLDKQLLYCHPDQLDLYLLTAEIDATLHRLQ